MIWAWDVDSTDPTFAARYHRAAMAEGVLLRPIGHTLYFMPPYALTESDQAFLVQAAVRALDKTLSEGAAGAHGAVVAMA
jgi:adenosylmethionine-8-amino-7-oxononanoate aminotransferase